MGNLGLYEEITREAKRLGGPDKLIEAIQDAAVSDAAPGHRRQGAGVATVVLVAGWAGLSFWRKYSADRRAERESAAKEAKTQLKAAIEEGIAESDTRGDDPDAEGVGD